jgi:hypothetical protein
MGSGQTKSSEPGMLLVHKYYEDCVKLKFYPEYKDDDYFCQFFYLGKDHEDYNKILESITRCDLIKIMYYEEPIRCVGHKFKIQNRICNLSVISLPKSINIIKIDPGNKLSDFITTDRGNKYFCEKSLINQIGHYAVKIKMTAYTSRSEIYRQIVEAQKIKSDQNKTD